MKTVALLALAVSSASAFAPSQSTSSKSVSVEATRSEIMSSPIGPETAGKIFDPLGLSELGGDETISWFRHSEVKHGRIAMAAFVGWCVAGAGLRLPGELAPGLSFSDIPSKGLEAWDAIPGWGKAQFLLFAGLIEFHDELFFSRRGTHYMRGGTPGKNMVPGLYDPLGFSKNRSEEAKARGRASEIKNGRLAMIGVAGLYAAATIPGSVPLQPDC
ncbi:chlorophyll A-B binding protein [Nitzschia inconspicua]|uniref:Chlorophyll A-B binding protein n=1 Tax=Nitzschia inconspicua TaxID=303405 RepID=A0A9K3LDW9_9STRA|nr:chlorophyll A-B binding protein [Nitzschia inconspicua]